MECIVTKTAFPTVIGDARDAKPLITFLYYLVRYCPYIIELLNTPIRLITRLSPANSRESNMEGGFPIEDVRYFIIPRYRF